MTVTVIESTIAPVDFKAGQLVYCKEVGSLVLVVDGDFENKSSTGCFAGVALASPYHDLFELDTFWATSSFELFTGEVRITN